MFYLFRYSFILKNNMQMAEDNKIFYKIDGFNFNHADLGKNIAYLDVSIERDDDFLKLLRENLIQESNNEFSYGRILGHQNILFPDITIMQNIDFYSSFSGLDSDIIINNINQKFPNIKSYLNQKRDAFSSIDWLGTGLLIYLSIPKDFYFINFQLAQFNNSDYDEQIMNAIKSAEESSVIIYSNPHSINHVNNYVDNFIVKNDEYISDVLYYDHAMNSINGVK